MGGHRRYANAQNQADSGLWNLSRSCLVKKNDRLANVTLQFFEIIFRIENKSLQKFKNKIDSGTFETKTCKLRVSVNRQ